MRLAVSTAMTLICLAAAGPTSAAADVLVDQSPNFTSVAGLTLTGDAQFRSQDKLVRLTPAAIARLGRMFADERISTSASFSTHFRIAMHDSNSSPGDGMAFVLRESDQRTPDAGGGGLGYQGYAPSLAVEFDTYKNGQPDPDANHIELTTTDADGDRSIIKQYSPPFSLYGNVISAWIDYDASVKRIQIYVTTGSTKPANPVIDRSLDLAALMPRSANAGLTAATGGATEVHDVLAWVLEGTPFAACAAGAGAIRGTSAAETLTGTSGPDVICGFGGDDVIEGGGGNDIIIGGHGDDRLQGDGGRDQLQGDLGADRMIGGDDVDTVTYAGRTASVIVDLAGALPDDGGADEHDDVRDDVENVIGGDSDDQLLGSAQNNTLTGRRGADTIDGRGGADTASYSDRRTTQPVWISLDGEPDSGGALDGPPGARDTILPSVENLVGGAGNDFLTGSGLGNVLDGRGGSDVFDGDLGTDTVTYARRSDAVDARINGRPVSGSAVDESSAGRDTITTSVERLTGGAGGDTLIGSLEANTLVGKGGADTLIGREGSDKLYANDGSADAQITCDGGSAGAAGANDLAVIDSGDPAPAGCESIRSGA